MQSAPLNGINYYKSVVEKLGRAGVDSVMRFFVTPGANHGGAGVSSVDGAALPPGRGSPRCYRRLGGSRDCPRAARPSRARIETAVCRHGLAPPVPLSAMAALLGGPPKDAPSCSCVSDHLRRAVRGRVRVKVERLTASISRPQNPDDRTKCCIAAVFSHIGPRPCENWI
jgi:hypothetical protein